MENTYLKSLLFRTTCCLYKSNDVIRRRRQYSLDIMIIVLHSHYIQGGPERTQNLRSVISRKRGTE